MKYQEIKAIFLVACFYMLCSSFISAQYVEWEYQVEDEVDTYSNDFWTDESGDGFYNIKKIDPDKPSNANYGAYLLILDKNGKLKGKTYIKDCNAQVSILPYGKNKLLTSGNRCLTNGYENSSTIYSYKGKILKTGKGFDGFYFARKWSNGMYYCFSKPLDHGSFSFVSVGTINEKLQLNSQKVSLKQFERKGMGIINSLKDPVQLKNDSWIIPMALAEKTAPNQDTFKPSHGFVMCTRGSEILWQYPREIIKQGLEQVEAYDNKVGVLFDRSYFVWLHEDGRELQRLRLNYHGFYAKDMIINKEEIIILGTHNITWFDHSGNLKSVFDFKSNNLDRARQIREVEDGGLILTAKKNNNVVVLKIFSGNELILDEVNTNPIVESSQEIISDELVGNTTIETVSDDLLSVSVFPNPATVYVNFEIGDNTNLDGPYFIEIVNQQGKVVHSKEFSDKFYSIELVQFIAGTYFYRIRVADELQTAFVSGQFVKF